jgi:hypothetical protein
MHVKLPEPVGLTEVTYEVNISFHSCDTLQ